MSLRLGLFFSIVLIILYSCGTSKRISHSKSNASSVSTRNDSVNLKSNSLTAKYSSLLNVEENKLDNIILLQFMDDWYGVPYKYAGKTKRGIDCSDFTSTLLKNVYNVEIQGPSESLYSQCTSVKKVDLQEGDLVFFKIRKGRISHVGVYLMNGYFVHATTHSGVIISNLNEDYYKKYYCCAGRVLHKE